MIDKLLNIDRRIVFLLIFISVAAAMLIPFGMEVRPSPNVRAVYDHVNTLRGREHPTVLLSFDYGPGSAPELQPTAINLIRQCFANDINVVGMALWPDAVGLAEAAFDSMRWEYGLPIARDSLASLEQNAHDRFTALMDASLAKISARYTRRQIDQAMATMSEEEKIQHVDAVLVKVLRTFGERFAIPAPLDDEGVNFVLYAGLEQTERERQQVAQIIRSKGYDAEQLQVMMDALSNDCKQNLAATLERITGEQYDEAGIIRTLSTTNGALRERLISDQITRLMLNYGAQVIEAIPGPDDTRTASDPEVIALVRDAVCDACGGRGLGLVEAAVYDSLARQYGRHLTVADLDQMNGGQGEITLRRAMLDSLTQLYSKKPGEDYVFLGYKPGATSLVLNMGENFKSAFARDTRGISTASMGATRPINKLEDFDYVITLAAGQTMDLVWVAYAVDRYNVTLGGACTAVMAPDMFPYLQSGQMNGLIAGLAGAAELEVLNEAPGSAVAGMRPQVAAHLVIIFFILFGNVMYFLQRRRQRAREV